MSSLSRINFQPLYKITPFFALAMLLIIPIQIAFYVLVPPPTNVEEFFVLFQQNSLLGLISLDLLYLLNNIILVFLYFALFGLLFYERPVTILLAFMLGLIGIACYFPSNPSFEMLILSDKFVEGLPEQKSIYIAAGEALLAGYTGTSFNVYYVLSTICLLLFSYSLIKSRQVKKSIGLWGLCSSFFMIIPSSAGSIGMTFSLLSLIPWVVFIVLLMLEFRRRGKNSAIE